MKLRDRVQRSKWSITRWLPTIAACSLAVTRGCDSGGAVVTSGDIPWARYYRTLVQGRDIGLDANVDGIVAESLVSYGISLSSDVYTNPFTSVAPYVGVIASKALRPRNVKRGNIGGCALVYYRSWTPTVSNFTCQCSEMKKR